MLWGKLDYSVSLEWSLSFRLTDTRLLLLISTPVEAGRKGSLDKGSTNWAWTGPVQPYNGYGELSATLQRQRSRLQGVYRPPDVEQLSCWIFWDSVFVTSLLLLL